MNGTPNGWFGSFLGLAGFVMTFAAFVAAYANNPDSPYFTTALSAIAVIGAFMVGFNAREMGGRLRGFTDERLQSAAETAVEARMAEVERIVDERVAALEAGLDERMAAAARRHDEESGTLHEGDIAWASDADVDGLFAGEPGAPTADGDGARGAPGS